ncbi:MAG: hypothetical protein E7218_01020 [Anaerofustis stercorihominis]|nr:hypothetical protein [Anaerofustis stercorihominis]
MLNFDNKNKVIEYEENPYSGILINSAIMGVISFVLMRLIYILTGNTMFSLEHSVNVGFTAAAVSPMYMFLSIYKEVKRYEMYEQGIDGCRLKVPVSILVNKGYFYVNDRNMYLVFASKKPHFISLMKLSTVEKVTLYDETYICVRIRNETSSNPYEIKFKVEGNMEKTVNELNSLLRDRIEDKRVPLSHKS